MIVAVSHQPGRSWRRTVLVDGQWRLLGEKGRLDEHSAVVCWGRPCATDSIGTAQFLPLTVDPAAELAPGQRCAAAPARSGDQPPWPPTRTPCSAPPDPHPRPQERRWPRRVAWVPHPDHGRRPAGERAWPQRRRAVVRPRPGADGYLALPLPVHNGAGAGRVLVVAPAALLHPRVPQPAGSLLYELATGHPGRGPRELVFPAEPRRRAAPGERQVKRGRPRGRAGRGGTRPTPLGSGCGPRRRRHAPARRRD